MYSDVEPQYKTPDGSALKIWVDAAQNNYLTEQVGRPIFDDVTYCEVISPGSRDSHPVFELRRKFAEQSGITAPRYSAKYAELKQYVDDFDKGEEASKDLTGTPLTEWPVMTRSMVASLRAQHIFTVDALANLPDEKLSVVGPDGRTWRETARAFIEAASDGAAVGKAIAENEKLKADSEDKDRQIAELAARIQALEADKAATPAAPAAETTSTPVKPPKAATGNPPADII